MTEFRANKFQAIPPVVKNLIIINVLVFLAQLAFDREYSLTARLALFPLDSPLFRPYQVVTHMFTHGGWWHILFNMFALWMFGSTLENYWGSKKFFIIYIVSGLGSAACLILMQYLHIANFLLAVGASGAIMGLFAAFGYLFPNSTILMLPFPFPIKAKWAVLILMATDLFGGFANVPGDNIAHFAHVGGAITGFLIVYIWNKTDRRNFY